MSPLTSSFPPGLAVPTPTLPVAESITKPDAVVVVPPERVRSLPMALRFKPSPERMSISPVPDPVEISMPPWGATRVIASAAPSTAEMLTEPPPKTSMS